MATILLIEDDADQRQLRRLILERQGHTVRAAASPAEAVELARQGPAGCALMDLCLPSVAEGMALIRALKALQPDMPILVLSGRTGDLACAPEAASVAATLQKPVRTEQLLKMIARFALGMLGLALMVVDAQPREFPFTVAQRAEIIASLKLQAPGSDWAKPGSEGALATLTLDGKSEQHLMVTGGARAYAVFLGALDAGRHTLKVDRHAVYSAPGAALNVLSAGFTPSAGEVLAHAPILLARSDTVGQFSDIPLVAYCTRGQDKDGRYLEYTVIFSNEDGGTSTRDLMARWGRTTDIEYIYRIWLGASGMPSKTLIQTREHEDIPYDGVREGSHPILMPVTDNNMVEPAAPGASPVRYQLVPVEADLNGGSREQVMDANPFTYEIAAKELEREGKLRSNGVFDGEKISDPRNYLVVEMKLESHDAGVGIVLRRRNESRWYSSAVGLGKNHIDRSGWVRTTVELPPGTRPSDIAEIGAQCLSLRDISKQPVPKNGRCTLERFGRVFFLGRDYVPQPPIALPAAGWRMEAGDMISAALP